MTMTSPHRAHTDNSGEILADLYLRLSDLRNEEQLDGREQKLRDRAAAEGWTVRDVIVENDLAPRNGNGERRAASAFKRYKVTRHGKTVLRTVRPGFQRLIEDLEHGRAQAVLVEDLDRLLRQPRDNEDLLDAVEMSGATVKSLSGSVTLTEGGTSDERFMARIMASMANKASADTGRRVSAARDRYVLQSWQGGRRPYGYRPDPDAPKYHKVLLVDPAEKAVILQAADDLLDKGISLKAAARDLRERGAPTVTGAAWTPETLKDALIKPAVAGLAVRNGTIVGPAPWEPILERDVWDRLRDKLTDPARRTTTANEPRWLVSGFAACGVCGKPLKVGGSGRGRGPAYVGADCGHVRRAAGSPDNLSGDPRGVDDVIARHVIHRLSRPDADDLLRPAPRPGTDARRLRAEARKLRDRKDRQVRLHAAGVLDDGDLTTGMRVIRKRLADIDRELADSGRADPLAEFRGRPAAEVWMDLGIARRRAVVQVLIASVIIAPAGRRGNRFDPGLVTITPRVPDA